MSKVLFVLIGSEVEKETIFLFCNMEIVSELDTLANLAELAALAMNCVEIDQRSFIRRWPKNERRRQQEASENLIREMRYQDDESFFNFTRMTMTEFDLLLHLVGPHIKKTSIRRPISPESRLLLTLRFLATGDSFRSLHDQFRIGYSTIPKIVYETCAVIHKILAPTYMPSPSASNLEEVSEGYKRWTSYPHIIGAIDGKHIAIFKKHFVLLGICDTNYKFVYFNVESYGSKSDGGIFTNSSIGQAFENGSVSLPESRPVNGSHCLIPYYLVGDADFPLRPYLMTPFSERNLEPDQILHNKELSKGLCFIENSFGILAARWKVFSGPISVLPQQADKIVLATVMLHNFLLSSGSNLYVSHNYVDQYINDTVINGEWRTDARGTRLESIPNTIRLGNRNPTSEAREIRNNIKNIIFNNPL